MQPLSENEHLTKEIKRQMILGLEIEIVKQLWARFQKYSSKNQQSCMCLAQFVLVVFEQANAIKGRLFIRN